MIPRSLLAGLSLLLLGRRPLEALPTWLAPLASAPAGRPEEIHLRLCAGRHAGRGGPWLPPFLCRWLRSPGCRQYAVLLLSELRRHGHDAALMVGAAGQGAHVWVECGGRAYDLEHPEGVEPGALSERYPLVQRYFASTSR